MGGRALTGTRVRPLALMARDLERARRGGAFGERERAAAAAVIADVRRHGDLAVLRTVRRFDDPRAHTADLLADRPILRRVGRTAPRELRAALDLAHTRIRAFHERQRPTAVEASDAAATLRLLPTPLRRVGALIPRGTSAYPSTALMTGVPARLAGVRELVAASPMTKFEEIDPALAYALSLVDVDLLYRAGGAAAVAALAYGTKAIGPVDKIVGPGNAYAAAAKWLVSADVGIDALQGPSELVVVASRGADARTLALDLLAQAEHGSGAVAVLVSENSALLRELVSALDASAAPVPRGRILLYRAPDTRAAARAANDAAPEHVMLAGRAAAAQAKSIDRAGAVFLGARSAVAFGDYVAGTNHCLPTGGTARWASALRVADFVRWTSRVEMRPPVRELVHAGATIARHEGMRYHAASLEARA